MRIGVDIDNVIAKFNEKLLEEYLKHDKQLRGNGIINHNAEYITIGMFDWSQEENDNFYYQNIESIACELDMVDDASKYIKKLREVGHEIYIISGRKNKDYSNPYKMTINWLKKYNIAYDYLILTDSYDAHEKTEVCLKHNIDVMIDDSNRICKDLKEHGINVLVMDTPYNQKLNNMKRVYNWEEIYTIIIKNKYM